MAEGTPQADPAQQVSTPSKCGGPWRRSPVQVNATAPLASASPTSPLQRGGLAEQALGQKQSQGWKHSPGELHGGVQMQFLPHLESCMFPAAEQKPETATGRVLEAVLWSVHSVCRQGWNESPHLQMSQYRHLWLSKLFRLLLQLSSTFF